MSIPLFHASLDAYRDRIVEAVTRVVDSGRYILGPDVEAFEGDYARFIGVDHCIGVANGTDALTIALRAMGVRPGDEVVMPSLTFYATAEASVNAGAVPVFCDVDPTTYCITADTVRTALTPRTKAIVAVHLFGNVAPVGELKQFGVPVLEDAAQAAGAALDGVRAGALGDCATFSFFPSKNLGCLGDGGAIVTSSDEIADRARRLRFHGSLDKKHHTDVGYNSRLDALQAAVLSVLLPELDGWNDHRRAVARAYDDSGLGELAKLPMATPAAEHVFHLYVTRADDAEAVVKDLGTAGVTARGYYRVPVHRQPAMRRFAPEVRLPVTDAVAATNVALPMGSTLPLEMAPQVVGAWRSLSRRQAA